MSYTFIDLFSGCGGLSLGLIKAKWKGLFAVEKSPDAFATLKYNLIEKLNGFDWPEWLPQDNYDIDTLITDHKQKLGTLKGKVTLLAGGPPCQGYSTEGKRKINDKRNKLIDSYLQFVIDLEPKMLLLENVPGFTMSFKKENLKHKSFSFKLINSLEEIGYKSKSKIVDFSDFGIPQSRKRFILVASRNGLEPADFFGTLNEQNGNYLKEKNLKSKISLKEAISDLLKENGVGDSIESRGFKAGVYSDAKSNYQKLMRNGERLKNKIADSHRFANHSTAIENKYKKILNKYSAGRNIAAELSKSLRTNKRNLTLLDENLPCRTLTTLPDDYIHYSEPRILTVREYARIQSFPDWFEFKGKYTTGGNRRRYETPRYTQVGNAVPPLFAEQCGIVLKHFVI